MALSQDNIARRNDFIAKRYQALRKKNPKWDIFFVIEEVAGEIFLSPVTVGKILGLTYQGIPAADTISRKAKKIKNQEEVSTA